MGLLYSGKLQILIFKYGWKAVFKITLMILKENEDAMIQMPFEIMLTQIN
jgi:hypothetical protein